MPANKSIIEVLKIDALELLGVLPYKPANPHEELDERSLGANRVNELPDLPRDLAREWEDSRPIEVRDLPETNIDLLAWYQPFSNFGQAEWGIFFDTSKMNQYALMIYSAVKAVRPGVRAETVHRAVWDEVMRHEREHAVQELTLAALVELGVHTALDFNTVYSSSSHVFEALASHAQHTDSVYRSPGSQTIDRNFVRHITSTAPKPAGYRDWDRIDQDVAIERAYALSFIPDLAVTLAVRLRKQVRKVKGNSYIQIPVYLK